MVEMNSPNVIRYFIIILMVDQAQASTFQRVTSNIRSSHEKSNKTLTVFVENKAPFAYYDAEKDTYRGIEIHLVDAIAERLHFNIVYTFNESVSFGKFYQR